MGTTTYTQYHIGADSDWLTGSGDNEETFAGFGNDTVRGAGGNGWLHGEQNDDDLYGGDAADSLDGGSGDDRLEGGADADRTTGGLGIDTFAINSTEPTRAIVYAAADPRSAPPSTGWSRSRGSVATSSTAGRRDERPRRRRHAGRQQGVRPVQPLRLEHRLYLQLAR